MSNNVQDIICIHVKHVRDIYEMCVECVLNSASFLQHTPALTESR